jgi:Domain of unknown function (DUF1963)
MSERDELEETALPAVLVRRNDLPVPFAHPARSFFGGLPRLPPQFAWPKADVRINLEPETVALTFMAQIDLTEVSASKWSPLPKRGTLYFFCSSVFVDEGKPLCRVLYSPTDGNAFPERTPPSDLMPLADPTAFPRSNGLIRSSISIPRSSSSIRSPFGLSRISTFATMRSEAKC